MYHIVDNSSSLGRSSQRELTLTLPNLNPTPLTLTLLRPIVRSTLATRALVVRHHDAMGILFHDLHPIRQLHPPLPPCITSTLSLVPFLFVFPSIGISFAGIVGVVSVFDGVDDLLCTEI